MNKPLHYFFLGGGLMFKLFYNYTCLYERQFNLYLYIALLNMRFSSDSEFKFIYLNSIVSPEFKAVYIALYFYFIFLQTVRQAASYVALDQSLILSLRQKVVQTTSKNIANKNARICQVVARVKNGRVGTNTIQEKNKHNVSITISNKELLILCTR